MPNYVWPLTNNTSPTTSILSDDVVYNSVLNQIKTYDSITGNYSPWKIQVRWTTTENIPLNGAYLGSGASLGTRILVKNQTDPVKNGIYLISGDNWQRTPDLPLGALASGTIVVVASAVTSMYFCNNVYPNDVVGVNSLVFQIAIINDLPSGIQGSIQYKNATYNSFEGSPYLLYSNTDSNNIMIIGDTVHSSYILPEESGASHGIPLSIKTNDSVSNTGNISIKAGNSGPNLKRNGNLNLQANDITIQTSIGGAINFTTGNTTRNSNINITAGSDINIATNLSDIIFYTKDIPWTIKDGGILTVKTTVSVTYPSDITSVSKQGIVNISSITGIGANSAGIIRMYNTNIVSTSLIMTNIQNYAGTGNPLVKLYGTNDGYCTFNIINISTSSSLSGVLHISYVIL
jgi:hypothetical protein